MSELYINSCTNNLTIDKLVTFTQLLESPDSPPNLNFAEKWPITKRDASRTKVHSFVIRVKSDVINGPEEGITRGKLMLATDAVPTKLRGLMAYLTKKIPKARQERKLKKSTRRHGRCSDGHRREDGGTRFGGRRAFPPRYRFPESLESTTLVLERAYITFPAGMSLLTLRDCLAIKELTSLKVVIFILDFSECLLQSG